jgi:hypothetical protein
MKRIILMLTLAAMLVVALTVTSATSFARITQENAGGNEPNGQANGIPAKNPADKCPPGQNTEQQLRKCER